MIEKAKTVSRLRTIRLRIDEITRLVAETDADLDAVQRIRTVQADLRQVHDGLLSHYLEHYLVVVRQQEAGATAALEGIGTLFCCKRQS